jgi:hypothetical protein
VSATTNVIVIGIPGSVWTEPAAQKYPATLAPADCSGNLPAQVKVIDDIELPAKQKADITAAVPDVTAIQSGLATTAGQVTIYNAVVAIPAAVWAVATRTLSGFGTLVADIAAAVWGAISRTLTSTATGTISWPVLSNAVRNDYIAAVGNMVGGASLPLGETEKIFAINKAVKTYSKERPRLVVEDEDGTGSSDYLLTLLADWSEGFSVIKTIEYPVDDTVAEASVLRDDGWKIYQKPTGKCLRFLNEKPTAVEDFRVIYTTLHVCTDEACTIPSGDEAAVQMLAAAEFCDMLATYYSQTQDSTIAADSVDHKSKASEYATRARTYRKLYSDHIGTGGGTGAASVTRDQELDGSFGGRITHPRKFR